METNLNALEVLFLHFVHGREKDTIVNSSQWLQSYSTNPNYLIDSLLSKNAIKISTDLTISLNKFKVPELKNILRKNNLKVSGNKPVLIDRIIENEEIINLNEINIPNVYVVTPSFQQLYDETEFINYFRNHYTVDIYDAYDYYLKNPEKSKDNIIIELLNRFLKIELDKNNMFEVTRIHSELSTYFHRNGDEATAQYHLHNQQMVSILHEIDRYRENISYGMYIDITSNPYLFYINDSTILQYKSLLKTRQISVNKLYQELIQSTQHLPYDKGDKEMAATYIIEKINENFDAAKLLINQINSSKNKQKKDYRKEPDIYKNQKNTEANKTLNYNHNNSINKVEKKTSGYLIFLSIPTLSILSLIMGNWIF